MQTEILPFRPGFLKRPRRFPSSLRNGLFCFSRSAWLSAATPFILKRLLYFSSKSLFSRSAILWEDCSSDPSSFLSAEVGGQTRLLTLKCM